MLEAAIIIFWGTDVSKRNGKHLFVFWATPNCCQNSDNWQLLVASNQEVTKTSTERKIIAS